MRKLWIQSALAGGRIEIHIHINIMIKLLKLSLYFLQKIGSSVRFLLTIFEVCLCDDIAF